MTRNPKLDTISKRLTPHQQMRRRQKMRKNGTWRQEMENAHAQTRGGVNASLQAVGKFATRQTRGFYVQGVQLAALVALAGKVFGWW